MDLFLIAAAIPVFADLIPDYATKNSRFARHGNLPQVIDLFGMFGSRAAVPWAKSKKFPIQREKPGKRYDARITSAAFSATMYTALTIKNPGMRGNTEASTTRNPSVPCTRKSLVSTPPPSRGPIGQVQEA